MKFKNTNKTKKVYKKAKPIKGKQLPSNYRTFTESIDRDELIYFTGIFCILAAILVVSVDLYKNFNEEKRLTAEKIQTLSDKSFWEYQIKERPDYRDAYFSLALINYKLRNLDDANENVDKAMSLDPNFKEGKELKNFLK